MTDIIIISILIVIIGLVFFYIYNSKKKGKKCIGCPNAECAKRHSENNNYNCCNKPNDN